MTTSEALIVAGTIHDLYSSKSKTSFEINQILAKSLEKEEYELLCKKMKKSNGFHVRHFKKAFFDNPNDEKLAVYDYGIACDYGFGMFMMILSEVIEEIQNKKKTQG